MTADKDIPGVVMPPPLLFLGFLVAGIIGDWFSGTQLLAAAYDQPRLFAACAVLGLAVCVMTAGIIGFRNAGTPVPTRETPTALVTSGVHGLSRNPLYIGLYSFYGGFALLANSLGAAVLLLPLAIVIRHGVVAREERYLARKFGDAYLEYKRRVPRWL